MIYILCGKSASGKDTVKNELLDSKKYGDQFQRVHTCTTRPRRDGEIDGRDYIFLSDDKFMELVEAKEIFESRVYETCVNGRKALWKYGSMKLDKKRVQDYDYICILDPNGVRSYINEYGKENITVIVLECDGIIRELRARKRGSFDAKEWCRRYQSDEEAFKNLDFDCHNVIYIDSSGDYENIAAYISIYAAVERNDDFV